MTRLAFLQLSESPFGRVLSVLLPSCSQLTYSANTQWVTTVGKTKDKPYLTQGTQPRPIRQNRCNRSTLRTGLAVKLASCGNIRFNLDWPPKSDRVPSCDSGCRSWSGEDAVFDDPRSANQSLDAVLSEKGDTQAPKRASGARPPSSGESRHTLAILWSSEVRRG